MAQCARAASGRSVDLLHSRTSPKALCRIVLRMVAARMRAAIQRGNPLKIGIFWVRPSDLGPSPPRRALPLPESSDWVEIRVLARRIPQKVGSGPVPERAVRPVSKLRLRWRATALQTQATSSQQPIRSTCTLSRARERRMGVQTPGQATPGTCGRVLQSSPCSPELHLCELP